MPNLKIGSPSAPNKNLANLGEGAAPATDIASNESVGSCALSRPTDLRRTHIQSAGTTSFCSGASSSGACSRAQDSARREIDFFGTGRIPCGRERNGRSGKRHGCRKRRCDWKSHRREGADRTDASPGSGCGLGETVEIFTRPGRRKTRCLSCDRECRIQVELVRAEFFLLLPFPITIRAGQPGR